MPTPLEWPLRDPIEAAGEAIGVATMTGDPAVCIDAAGQAIGVATGVGAPTVAVGAFGEAIGVAIGSQRNYDSAVFYLDVYDRMSFTSLGTSGDTDTIELTPAENRESSPFPYPALEAIRRHTISAVTTSSVFAMQARTTTILAYSTEVRAIFDGIHDITAKQLAVTRTGQRRVLAIDGDLSIVRGWFTQAFDELLQLGVPQAFIDLLRPRLDSRAFNDRVAAICAIVLLAAILILEDEQR